MIRFNYKNAQKIFGMSGSTVMDLGISGITGVGMVSSSKGHKAAMKEGKEGLEATNRSIREQNKHLDEIEKTFGFPWAAALSSGMMGGSMLQSSSQAKDQKEMNEEQIAAQDRQTQVMQRQNAILQRLEQRGGSPEQAAQVISKDFSTFSVLREKEYAINTSGVTTAVKDLWKAGKGIGVKKSLKGSVLFGLGTAGAAYGVNKIISHDMKKSGLDIDESGNLIQKQKSYASTATQKATESAAKKSGKGVFKNIGGKLMGPGMIAAFEAPRAIGYFGEKKALMGQVEGTQNSDEAQQRSYSSWGKKAIEGWKAFKKSNHKGRSISGGILNFGSFGALNTERVQGIAKNLATNSKSDSMRKLGKWAQDHKALANTALIVPGVAAASGAYGLGEKIVKKPMEKIDPDAYKYQKAKDNLANAPQANAQTGQDLTQ